MLKMILNIFKKQKVESYKEGIRKIQEYEPSSCIVNYGNELIYHNVDGILLKQLHDKYLIFTGGEPEMYKVEGCD